MIYFIPSMGNLVFIFWQIHPPLLISDWCAKIYEHVGYSGWEKVIQETSHLDLKNENDQTSSVRVKPGCTLNLFKNHNNDELLDSLTADVSALGKHSTYNDQVSSLSCTCQGMISTPTHLELYPKYMLLTLKAHWRLVSKSNIKTIISSLWTYPRGLRGVHLKKDL